MERLLATLRDLNVTRLRTGISWTECQNPAGIGWYNWLLPRLAREVEVLPCFDFGLCWRKASRSAAPPAAANYFVNVLDVFVASLGRQFDWVELGTTPDGGDDPQGPLEPDRSFMFEMIADGADRLHRRGKRIVLGGIRDARPSWIELIRRKDLIARIDAIGIAAFPGSRNSAWHEWAEPIDELKVTLARHGLHPQVWVTETGYSTWRRDELGQLHAMDDLLRAPAERVYWYAAHDHDPLQRDAHPGAHPPDGRGCHFGLCDANVRPKLLARLWLDHGLFEALAMADRARCFEARLTRNSTSSRRRERVRPTLITGGAGFIGTNLAARLAPERPVLILDNLCRPGVENNLHWLLRTFGNRIRVAIVDVRDRQLVKAAVSEAAAVYHCATRAAVAARPGRPSEEFEIDAGGTLNVLEAIRAMEEPPPLVFTSTSKVYGSLGDVAVEPRPDHYRPVDREIAQRGIDESVAPDLCSPCGCSKAAAEQYVLDYAHGFGLPATVLRLSSIYGPRHPDTQGQGWVAHFLWRSMSGKPVTIYGDGRQVRDILYVDDLVEALRLAMTHIGGLSGRAYNLGGGPCNSVSLRQLVKRIRQLQGVSPAVRFERWRNGDPKYYVSDCGRFAAATGWFPRVSIDDGIARLHRWHSERYQVPETVDLQVMEVS